MSLLSFSAWGEIYRWVDAGGHTHFSSQPPTGANAEQMLHQPDGAIESAETTQKRENRERIRSTHTPTLNCPTALAHLRSSLSYVDFVVEEAYKRADLSDAVYHQALQRSKVLKSRISARKCAASRGKLRKFYACLANSDDAMAVFSCNHTQAYEREEQDWSKVAKRPILQKVLWGIIEGEDIKKPD